MKGGKIEKEGGGRKEVEGRREGRREGRKKKREEEEGRGGGRKGEINSTYPFGYLHVSYTLPPNHTFPSLQTRPQAISSLLTTYLQDGEVFKHTIHHVSLREVLQTMDETDHVVTHRRTVNTINKPTIVKSCIFSLEKRERAILVSLSR